MCFERALDPVHVVDETSGRLEQVQVADTFHDLEGLRWCRQDPIPPVNLIQIGYPVLSTGKEMYRDRYRFHIMLEIDVLA
jgi:hypothetical protein